MVPPKKKLSPSPEQESAAETRFYAETRNEAHEIGHGAFPPGLMTFIQNDQRELLGPQIASGPSMFSRCGEPKVGVDPTVSCVGP